MWRIIRSILVICVLLITGFVFWLSGKYTVPIMMYHSVNDTPNAEAPTVTPEMFDKQMEYLKKHKYNVMSLAELVDLINEKKPFPRKSVVVTFDDGFVDNHTYAYPILKKHGFPATLFMPSAKIGQKGRLGVGKLTELIKNNFTVASHTHNETYLPDLTPEEQQLEIEISKQVLQKHLGVEIDFISYPIGGFSRDVKEFAKNAGYKAACATNRGYDRFNKDVFELNRIRFGNKDKSAVIMRAKLSGYYNLFRRLRASH